MKRGQVTIFIIISVLIVAAFALLFTFFPQIKSGFVSELKNPNAFMESCMEDELNNVLDTMYKQGGSLAPQHYYMYFGDKIEYLCYTNEYYRPCLIQQPFLKEHIEGGIHSALEGKAKECLDELKTSYEKKGYIVELEQGEMAVELLPKRVAFNFRIKLSLRKGESTENYDNILIYFEDNIYEFISIVQSILESESHWGDTIIDKFMILYRNLQLEKYKQTDGSKIFILTDLTTDKKFQFATRGIAWPPGGSVDE